VPRRAVVPASRWRVATGRRVARPSSLTPRASPGSASASSSSRARSTDWTPSLPRRTSAAGLGWLVLTTSLLGAAVHTGTAVYAEYLTVWQNTLLVLRKSGPLAA